MSQATARAVPAAAAGHTVAQAATFFGSTVGQKVVMAVTGLILFGFVVGHMVGNLQLYLGADAMNHYAVFLREFLHGGGLWLVRAVLLLAVALHVWAATALTLTSRRARPVGYRVQQYREADYASRTMRWSGPILLLFIIYHLLHLTTGTAHPSFSDADVYRNVVAGFRVWPASLFYIVAMLALGLHMFHGVWSMLQTFGLSHPRYNGLRMACSSIVTIVVVVGNISFPVAVLTRLVR
jgi:succinate dehydrogenase / fumarate reductase, cytochrome b subunit